MTISTILSQAEVVVDRLADPSDPPARQEAYRLLFISLAAGVAGAFGDPDLQTPAGVTTEMRQEIGRDVSDPRISLARRISMICGG